MKAVVGICLGLWAGTMGLALAEEARGGATVVELYTSQGCSSCPPADEVLGGLAGRDDVIALALHVDYWDYLGWADDFARPGHAARQKAYARVAGARTVYTPQMVVGGLDRLVGARPDELGAAIARQAAAGPTVGLTLTRQGDGVRIALEPAGGAAGPAEVHLVRYRPEAEVAIRRGENGGRTITYHNIVTDWQVVGAWNGRDAETLEAPAPGKAPVVVIVQAPGPGAILAAARLR